MHSLPAFVPLLCALVCPALSFGQVTYSYKDESGVLVLTNIAPSKPVKDLKVYGVPAPPASAANTAADPGVKSTKSKNRKPVNQVAKASNPDTPLRSNAQPSAVIPAADTSHAAPRTDTAQRGDDLGPIIDKYATEFGLEARLVRSVIATESGFKKNAVSSKGALGLMQLMPSTAAKLGVRDPFDPEQNIRGGTKHLRFLMDTFNNDLPLSLAAYNAGENLVQKLGRVPDIPETHNYVRSVMTRFGERQMKQSWQQPASPPIPRVFRYLDQNGVLVLTNIPPVGASSSMMPGQGQSPK